MKKNTLWIVLLIASVFLPIFSSCEDKVFYENSEPSVNWEIINYTAEVSDWRWSRELNCYVCEKKIPELTKFIFDEGAILGYVFWGLEGSDEVQVQLPFHKEGINITYDVSFDLDRTICFYYQDVAYPGELPVRPINFRIVLIS